MTEDEILDRIKEFIMEIDRKYGVHTHIETTPYWLNVIKFEFWWFDEAIVFSIDMKTNIKKEILEVQLENVARWLKQKIGR